MNSLSDSDRAFIMECAQEAIDYNWELADQSEEEILKQLEDAGFPVNDVDISVRRQLDVYKRQGEGSTYKESARRHRPWYRPSDRGQEGQRMFSSIGYH